MSPTRVSLALLTTLVLLAGCGKKGPLYYPGQAGPGQVDPEQTGPAQPESNARPAPEAESTQTPAADVP